VPVTGLGPPATATTTEPAWIASLKVAEILLVTGMTVAPLAGEVAVTVGAVVSGP